MTPHANLNIIRRYKHIAPRCCAVHVICGRTREPANVRLLWRRCVSPGKNRRREAHGTGCKGIYDRSIIQARKTAHFAVLCRLDRYSARCIRACNLAFATALGLARVQADESANPRGHAPRADRDIPRRDVRIGGTVIPAEHASDSGQAETFGVRDGIDRHIPGRHVVVDRSDKRACIGPDQPADSHKPARVGYRHRSV